MLYLFPWEAVAGEVATGLERELQRELGERHFLFGKPPLALARSLECDDVLYRFPDGSCAVVHLTYTERPPEPDRWPSFEAYGTLLDFARKRMFPDHAERLLAP
jgi:hypothetical protein